MTESNPNYPFGPYTPGEHVVPPARPASPATAEYRLNHLMLRIKNPDESLKFYCDCLGLHVVFIVNAGPPCCLHCQRWAMDNILPWAQRYITTTGTNKGLLELYHIPADSETEYTSGNDYTNRSGVGFGHIGFTVPDVAEALERVKSFGFEVIKPLEDDKEEKMGVPDDIVKGKYEPVHEGYKHVFRQLAFVKDPDGYWVELVPQIVKKSH